MLVHILSFSVGILDGFYNRQYFLLICRSSPLQKSSKILSISSPWFIDFTGSFRVLINCASQDGYFLKPCCGLFTMLFFSRCFMTLLYNTCSKTLHEMDAWRTVMQFKAFFEYFFPPLNNGGIRVSLHVFDISLCVNEALNNSVIPSVTCFEVSFSILAGIPSGLFGLYTFKSSRSFCTPSVVIVISSILDSQGYLTSRVFDHQLIKTLLNWWFRIRALYLSAIFIVLFLRRSDITTLSFLLLLMELKIFLN